jgi:hypothetical protein
MMMNLCITMWMMFTGMRMNKTVLKSIEVINYCYVIRFHFVENPALFVAYAYVSSGNYNIIVVYIYTYICIV